VSYDLEHNATTKKELTAVSDFVATEIDIEYDIDEASLTIVVLEPTTEEQEKIMHFLVEKGYVVPKRSQLEKNEKLVYYYTASDCNHSIYHFHGHFFDVVDGGWCGGEDVCMEKDQKFIEKLKDLLQSGKVGKPDYM